MSLRIKQNLSLLLIAALAISQSACSKEKAAALKTAADSFRVEAEAALEETAELLTSSITSRPRPRDAELEDIARELRANEYTEQQLVIFLEEKLRSQDPAASASKNIEQELSELQAEYRLFASMFRSLPRGYLFTKNTVTRAERHAARLTYRMVKMAKSIDENPIENLSARAELISKIIDARSLPDQTSRDRKLTAIANEVIDLRSSEISSNNNLKIQLLKAAEAGKTVIELIRNFDKWSVADILNAVGDSLKTLDELDSGDHAKLKKLIAKYDEFVESQLRTDQVWREALNYQTGNK